MIEEVYMPRWGITMEGGMNGADDRLPYSGRHYSVGYLKLWVAEAGQGPPLLLLHGLAAGADTWQPVLTALAEERHVIAPDLPGCRRSDKPETGYEVDAMASVVLGLMDVLDLSEVNLLGHSLGGPARPSCGRGRSTSSSTCAPTRRSAPDRTVASRTSPAAVEGDMGELARWKAKEVLPLVDAPAVVLWAPEGMAEKTRPLFSRASLQRAVEMMPNGRLVTVEGANHFTIGFAPDCVTQLVVTIEDLLVAR